MVFIRINFSCLIHLFNLYHQKLRQLDFLMHPLKISGCNVNISYLIICRRIVYSQTVTGSVACELGVIVVPVDMNWSISSEADIDVVFGIYKDITICSYEAIVVIVSFAPDKIICYLWGSCIKVEIDTVNRAYLYHDIH